VKGVRFSRFGGPEVLEIVELPDPHPGPDEVRIAVHAAGINASDWKKRQGLMDGDLPQTMGYEAAGVVDELGDGVMGVAVGDRVFGLSGYGAAQAELAVLTAWSPIPSVLDFASAAALPSAVETAARALDQLGVAGGGALLVNGASGNVGGAAVQLAVARGARVIGTASSATHGYLRKLGAEPVVYGPGLTDRVRGLAAGGVDWALDVAGSGDLPELIELAGGADHVITIADFAGAQQCGVRFSRGDSGRAIYALALVGELVESGKFSLPIGQTFTLDEVAEAHRVGEAGRVRGKLVLLIDGPSIDGRVALRLGVQTEPPTLLGTSKTNRRPKPPSPHSSGPTSSRSRPECGLTTLPWTSPIGPGRSPGQPVPIAPAIREVGGHRLGHPSGPGGRPVPSPLRAERIDFGAGAVGDTGALPV
jgi:NADPH:quinone reductase-like Zn-dependent oxidoreductase